MAASLLVTDFSQLRARMYGIIVSNIITYKRKCGYEHDV